LLWWIKNRWLPNIRIDELRSLCNITCWVGSYIHKITSVRITWSSRSWFCNLGYNYLIVLPELTSQ
jgi:hypothetical protein